VGVEETQRGGGVRNKGTVKEKKRKNGRRNVVDSDPTLVKSKKVRFRKKKTIHSWGEIQAR